MPRGGYRKNAGRKPIWDHQDTTTVRLPTVLVEDILFFAHYIDKLERQDRKRVIDSLTKSKNNLEFATNSKNDDGRVLNLRGIEIGRLHGRTLVFLSDLQKAGYTIEPSVLRKVVLAEG